MPCRLSLCPATASVPEGNPLSAWIPAGPPPSPRCTRSREERSHSSVSHRLLRLQQYKLAHRADTQNVSFLRVARCVTAGPGHVLFTQTWTLTLSSLPCWPCLISMFSAHLLRHLAKFVPQPPSLGGIKYSFSLTLFLSRLSSPQSYAHPVAIMYVVVSFSY